MQTTKFYSQFYNHLRGFDDITVYNNRSPGAELLCLCSDDVDLNQLPAGESRHYHTVEYGNVWVSSHRWKLSDTNHARLLIMF